MTRTATRPIPMGHIARDDAMAFGWALSAMAVATMWLFVGMLAAFLLAFTVFFYVVVYTLWPEAPHAPEYRGSGGLRGGVAAGDRLGFAVTGSPARLRRSCWWRSFSCGRRLFSGSCSCGAARIMPAPACRCCPWCAVSRPPGSITFWLYTLLLAPLGVVPAPLSGLGGMLDHDRCRARMGFGWMRCALRHSWRGARWRSSEPGLPSKPCSVVSLLYVFVPSAALIVERLLHLPPLWI